MPRDSLSDQGGSIQPRCGHRSPLNYDRTRYATCVLALGHESEQHRDGEFVWTDRTMPWRRVAIASDQLRPVACPNCGPRAGNEAGPKMCGDCGAELVIGTAPRERHNDA